MTQEQKTALATYVALVRERYGERLVDLVVFGSRARGDHHDASDLDLAIVLRDGDWDYWTERFWLLDGAYQSFIDVGLRISPRPVRQTAWINPDAHGNPRLVRNMRRDAKRVEEAA